METGVRIATASVRTGFAMTPFQEVRYKTGRVVREADPYGCVTRGVVRRADVGSELSAAGGG